MNEPTHPPATIEPTWIDVRVELPELGEVVEILHFGDSDQEFTDRATVDRWGICPHATDNGHGKRSTVTHWRRILPDALEEQGS